MMERLLIFSIGVVLANSQTLNYTMPTTGPIDTMEISLNENKTENDPEQDIQNHIPDGAPANNLTSSANNTNVNNNNTSETLNQNNEDKIENVQEGNEINNNNNILAESNNDSVTNNDEKLAGSNNDSVTTDNNNIVPDSKNNSVTSDSNNIIADSNNDNAATDNNNTIADSKNDSVATDNNNITPDSTSDNVTTDNKNIADSKNASNTNNDITTTTVSSNTDANQKNETIREEPENDINRDNTDLNDTISYYDTNELEKFPELPSDNDNGGEESNPTTEKPEDEYGGVVYVDDSNAWLHMIEYDNDEYPYIPGWARSDRVCEDNIIKGPMNSTIEKRFGPYPRNVSYINVISDDMDFPGIMTVQCCLGITDVELKFKGAWNSSRLYLATLCYTKPDKALLNSI